MNEGFVVLAQNTKSVDYVKCAEMLAYSVKKVMPNASISLISDDVEHSKYFDYVIALPYGDLAPNSDWKLVNDWQVYEASPYKYTIKLEADMFIPVNIDYWWRVLKNRELVVCSSIRNYKGDISSNRFYRAFIDNNQLPDVYNAITYFKKCDFSEMFFKSIKTIFENWDDFKQVLKCDPNELVTTDWAYAIACNIYGIEKTTMPNWSGMSMVHMKQFINDLKTEDWTKELVYEISKKSLRVNTFTQVYPFHYHVKTFSEKLEHEFA
jgi:hypothetical protein